jgi:hypothetical protein
MPEEDAVNETDRADDHVTVDASQAEAVPVADGGGRWLTWRLRVVLLLAGIVVAGVVSGVIWHQVVTLPTYQVLSDGTAQITERGLSRVFALDAWYVFIGLLGGMLLGTLVWKLMEPLGWPAALIACAATLLAGVICWQIGRAFGPRDFVERLAAIGTDGGRLEMDFDLSAKSALLVWPIGGLLPVLLYPASELMVEWLGRHRRREVTKPE